MLSRRVLRTAGQAGPRDSWPYTDAGVPPRACCTCCCWSRWLQAAWDTTLPVRCTFGEEACWSRRDERWTAVDTRLFVGRGVVPRAAREGPCATECMRGRRGG